jgi:ATP adenylyltransferase
MPDNVALLWAPWRIGYILGPRSENCVFCQKGADDEVNDEANLVLERGAYAFVLMNTYPYNPGHLLVTPYEHVADLEDVPRASQHEMLDMTVRWKQRLGAVTKAQGFNVGLNLGAVAGAGITEHLHFHVVPRWQGDTNFMSTVSDTRVISQSLGELYTKLRAGSA